jgi:hypothetical protein
MALLSLQGAAIADALRDPLEVRSVNGVCDVVLDAVVHSHPFPAAGASFSLRAPVYVLRRANGKDVPQQAYSAGEEQLPFLVLADANREAFRRYGCIDASDTPLHGTFFLDRQGKVRWRNVGKEPYMDAERVLADLLRSGPKS